MIDGYILQRTGPLSYKASVGTSTGTVTWRRHVNQLIAASGDTSATNMVDHVLLEVFNPAAPNQTVTAGYVTLPSAGDGYQTETRRYPSRDHRPPVRYKAM